MIFLQLLPVNGDSRFNLRYNLQPSHPSLRREGVTSQHILPTLPSKTIPFTFPANPQIHKIQAQTKKNKWFQVPSQPLQKTGFFLGSPNPPTNPTNPTETPENSQCLLPTDTSRRSTPDLFLRDFPGGKIIS